MQGFIVNDATVTVITGSYVLGKKVLLHEDSSSDPLSKAMPNSCYLSHLDIQCDNTTGTHTKISCFLSWDEDGDDPMTAVSTGNPVWTGMTDTSLLNTCIALDVWVTRPTGQTTSGKCYLHVRGNTSGAEMSLTKARLHWVTRATI